MSWDWRQSSSWFFTASNGVVSPAKDSKASFFSRWMFSRAFWKTALSSTGAIPLITAASMACGPCSIQTASSPTSKLLSVSPCFVLNESCTKSWIAFNIPETISASWKTTDSAITFWSNNPLSLCIRKTCSTRYKRVWEMIISAYDFPVLKASILHFNPCHEKFCSRDLLIDWIMLLKVSEMAFLIAGPMTGKRASAKIL